MINFEEELKKFHPSLEIEDAEDAIHSQDLTDVADILINMLKIQEVMRHRAEPGNQERQGEEVTV
ncbi:MAG: hypothetical protein IKM28_08640 [Lachnospiraceae bacterium]|nr:hypothetical protein [Lachnospiraceae bacterium]